jgi:ribosomal protein L37E
MVSHIKCPNCGTFNTNAEYCKNCNTPLSYKKRRELEHAKETDERRERERIQSEKEPSFYIKYKDHRFLLVRIIVKAVYSIWMAFVAIGMFIAWLITAIAA